MHYIIAIQVTQLLIGTDLVTVFSDSTQPAAWVDQEEILYNFFEKCCTTTMVSCFKNINYVESESVSKVLLFTVWKNPGEVLLTFGFTRDVQWKQ